MSDKVDPPYTLASVRGDIKIAAATEGDFDGDIVFETGGQERARILSDGTGTGWANVLGGSMPVAGTADPATYLPSGTEYVWMQMDGAGNLIDIISGEVA